MHQKLFQFFYYKKREPQKPRTKSRQYVYYIFTDNTTLLAIQCKWWFLQKCINFVEQRQKPPTVKTA